MAETSYHISQKHWWEEESSSLLWLFYVLRNLLNTTHPTNDNLHSILSLARGSSPSRLSGFQFPVVLDSTQNVVWLMHFIIGGNFILQSFKCNLHFLKAATKKPQIICTNIIMCTNVQKKRFTEINLYTSGTCKMCANPLSKEAQAIKHCAAISRIKD